MIIGYRPLLQVSGCHHKNFLTMEQEISATDFWTWDSRCSGKLRVVNIGLCMLGMTQQQTRPWKNNKNTFVVIGGGGGGVDTLNSAGSLTF
jgi:NADH dehydrogenase FAD-containing subunit